MKYEAVILDIDGTLVDSNYQHVIAWQRAFRDSDVEVPAWRIHRTVGMGGDQMIEKLAGQHVEDQFGDAIRDAEKEHYEQLLPEVAPLEGARQLIVDLKDAGLTVILASSAKEEEVEHYVDLLDAGDICDGRTSSGDVDATKPEPDLIEVAVEKAGGGKAIMVGDSVWDVESAKRAGIETVAVLCGGFGKAELEDAGAITVVESVDQVARQVI